MAPELTSGEPVDGRADIYALGCVGYFLLTGTMVFLAETPVQLLLRHLQATPKPPSARLGAPIPAALEQLILRCLAKRPDDRPAGARELCAALEQADAGEWSQEDARGSWETSDVADDAPDPSPTTAPAAPTLLETAVSGVPSYASSRSSSSP